MADVPKGSQGSGLEESQLKADNSATVLQTGKEKRRNSKSANLSRDELNADTVFEQQIRGSIHTDDRASANLLVNDNDNTHPSPFHKIEDRDNNMSSTEAYNSLPPLTNMRTQLINHEVNPSNNHSELDQDHRQPSAISHAQNSDASIARVDPEAISEQNAAGPSETRSRNDNAL